MRLQLILLLALTGCVSASTPPVKVFRFSRPDTTQQTFLQDRYQCAQESQQYHAEGRSTALVNRYFGSARSEYKTGMVANANLYLSCMAARGYTLDDNGPLVATNGWIQFR
jgi:hypothetical protein